MQCSFNVEFTACFALLSGRSTCSLKMISVGVDKFDHHAIQCRIHSFKDSGLLAVDGDKA